VSRALFRRLPPWLALSLRELRARWRAALFLALNLACGLAGFVALDGFERSVAAALALRSRDSLGADVAVRSARALGEEEISALDAVAGSGAQVSRVVQLYSMAGVPGRARLVELRAVDERYPLCGELALEARGSVGDELRREFAASRGLWVERDLLAQLRVSPGDELALGAQRFRIDAVVERDAGRQSGSVSMAPRVYLPLAALAGTGLADFGSRVDHQRLYRLAEGADADAVAAAMRASQGATNLRVQSHREATRDLTRAYAQVTRYLSLAAIAAVFLAGIGASHLLRAQLARRLSEIAVLLSLGATRATALLAVIAELWWIAIAAALFALAGGALLLVAIGWRAQAMLPPGASLELGPASVALAFALALLAGTASCVPLVEQIWRLRPAELFREQAQPRPVRGLHELVAMLPSLALLFGLAVWRSGDLRVGAAFGAPFFACVVLFAWLSRRLLCLPARFAVRAGLPLRLALRALARRGQAGSAEFVAIALCAHLLSLSPQLRSVIAGELERPAEQGRLPTFFLFDIQPEQVAGLREVVAAAGSSLERVSPLVRARLDAVRGEPVVAREGDAEEEGGAGDRAAELRSRRYNLTYGDVPTPSERLVAGERFAPRAASDEVAQLCLEADFAGHLGVSLGDALRFDVQGVPVEGRVQCLKQVRWNSFQPNFFVTVQPGVLEEAPQTFLASIPELPAGAREPLRAAIGERFPNVVAIDVTAAVKRISELLDQLALAVSATSALSLAVGALLVFAIARDQARARRWEINLEKVLGADPALIRRALDLELGLLTGAATAIGVSASIGAAALLARQSLEGDYRPDLASAALLIALVPAICIATARVASRFVLAERPLVLLREVA
jgi:putative ABC transport system permease protein